MTAKRKRRDGYSRPYLARAMQENGWSTSDVAKMCKTTKKVVDNWVQGYTDPTDKYRAMLADLFNLCNRLDDGYDMDEYVDAFLELMPVR